MIYNPFDHYPLSEERLEEAPNWFMALERSLYRSDGLRLRRDHNRAGWIVTDALDSATFLSARQVGSSEDLAAAHHLDRVRPLTPPDVACGQVWVSEDGAEAQILAVARDMTGMGSPVAIVATLDGLQPLIWSRPPDGAVLAAGLGAPWVPADWRKPTIHEEGK